MLKVSNGPELVFAFVGAVGAQLDRLYKHLQTALDHIGYTCSHIEVIKLLNSETLPRYQLAFNINHKSRSYHAKMNAGNDFRRHIGLSDALARESIRQIRAIRTDWNRENLLPDDQPIPSRAYVLNSLKRPEEVALLRDVYGDSFYLIGAYARWDDRRTHLKRVIADSPIKPTEDAGALADDLIRRDLREKDDQHGQNVRDTFPEADFFVEASEPETAGEPIDRFIRLLFGHEFKSPTRDECGMHQAFGARLRSADLARQVGACVTTKDGQVLALGTNEVPRPGGGQYWDESGSPLPHPRDGRDFMLGRDESNVMRRKLIIDTVDRLEARGVIDRDVANALRSDDAFRAVRDGRLMAVTEYGRSVHAEMAAITDAARRGIAIGGSVLYTSTFPCHNCAKHIVAAGIERVVYIHPYPKSQVASMYEDSIAIDETSTNGRVHFVTFVGVAPRRYDTFFAMKQKRKNDDGRVLQWGEDPDTVVLRIESSPLFYLSREQVLLKLVDDIREKNADLFSTRVEPEALDAREER